MFAELDRATRVKRELFLRALGIFPEEQAATGDTWIEDRRFFGAELQPVLL